jgi:hypothetical protein
MSVTAGNDPQFERMEPRGASAASTCAACQRTIPDVYYEAGGKVFCAACKDAAAVALTGGSGLVRLVKAGVLGTVAAALSAGVWWGIMKVTGYELGIVAVAVGLAVGGAVRLGAEHRGGWLYQVMAVGLTYLAIVTAYVPLVLESLEQETANAEVQEEGAFAGAEPEPEAEEAALEAEAAAGEEMVEVPPLFVAIVGSFMLPVLQVMDGGVIGFLIVCFALYEAWKINKRQRIDFSGPFQLQRGAGA